MACRHQRTVMQGDRHESELRVVDRPASRIGRRDCPDPTLRPAALVLADQLVDLPDIPVPALRIAREHSGRSLAELSSIPEDSPIWPQVSSLATTPASDPLPYLEPEKTTSDGRKVVGIS